MSTQWDSIEVRCPYYKKHDKTSITCEAINKESSSVKIIFNTKESRRQHMKEYCNKDYNKCSICKLCEAKYN